MSSTTASWTAGGSSWWRSPGTGARQGQDQSQAPGPGPEAGGSRQAGVGAEVGLAVLKTDLAARARNLQADQDHKRHRTLIFVVAL